MSKITAYTALSTPPQYNDVLPIVDVNDTTMAATGTTKKLTVANLGVVGWYNVKFYGAKGDGTTDDTTAIQAVINGLPAAGGVVYFPAGTYKLSSALTVGTAVTLIGDGALTSILHQTSTTSNGIFLTEASTYVSDVTITALQILGPSSGSGVGIYGSADADTQGVWRVNVDNVVVTSMGGNGIEIHNALVSVFNKVQSSFNNANGFYLEGIPVGTSCTFISCYAKSNGSRGYYLNNVVYSSLNGCASDFNQNGYVFNICAGVTVSGCGSETQTVDHFVFSGGNGNALIGCWTYQNAHYALNVLGGESGLTVMGFTENGPVGGAVNSIITASGTSALIANYTVTTATSFASGTTTLTSAGALATTGILAANAGTKSSGSAPVLTPAFANGTAAQLSDLTRDYMVYLTVTTSGTATTLAIGPTSTPANTIISSTAATAGTMWTFRLPAGWYVKWAGTTTAIATQTAIGC